MFDEPSSPQKPAQVEDIFAQAEPPAASSSRLGETSPPQPPAANLDWTPPPAGSARRWLKWVGLGVGVLILAGGGWYLWSQSSSSITPASVSEPLGETPSSPSTETTPPPGVPEDTDGDGLTDTEEASLGTDPRRADSDEDGLFDREESVIYQSNPLQFDTDGDGYSDGQEVQNGYSPVGPGRLLELPSGS